eukprot:10277467-Heterocapsa_arctica.AAC.1
MSFLPFSVTGRSDASDGGLGLRPLVRVPLARASPLAHAAAGRRGHPRRANAKQADAVGRLGRF